MSESESGTKSAKSFQERLERRKLKFQQYLDVVEGAQSYAFRIIALIFLVGVEVALFVALFKGKDPSAGLVTAITIIAVLPILVIRVFDISVLNLSKEGIQTQMLRTEMDEALSAEVDRLFAFTMSDPVRALLSQLAKDAPVSMSLDEEWKRKLFYLENIGYIEIPSKDFMKEEKVENLKDYAKVTDHGKEFLELRSRYS